nr:immunoglobulin heavy chain junction region [Macaca mulatta]MOX96595.1 immunoglobulin heavy chain junction region [Macaca mulatta]
CARDVFGSDLDYW